MPNVASPLSSFAGTQELMITLLLRPCQSIIWMVFTIHKDSGKPQNLFNWLTFLWVVITSLGVGHTHSDIIDCACLV